MLFRSLLSKGVAVGWGISNNIGLILLFTIPFTFYLAITNKTGKTMAYTFISFCQMITIIFTYSRGSIIALTLGLIFLLPLLQLLVLLIIEMKRKKMDLYENKNSRVTKGQ